VAAGTDARVELAALPAATGGGFRGTLARYASSEAITSIMSVVGVALFTRLVPPREFGAYSVTLAGSAFVAAVAGEWIQAAAVRLGAGVTTPAGLHSFHRALRQLVLTVCGVVALATAIGAFLPHTDQGVRLVVLGGIHAALTLAFLALTAFFQASHQAGRFARYRSAFAILRIAGGTACAVLLAASAESLVAGTGLSLVLLLPFVLRHAVPQPAGGAVAGGEVDRQRRAIVSFGLPLIAWYLASQVLNLSDRFFLQAWRGSEEVGFYSVAYALVMGATVILIQPLLLASYPALVRAWEGGGVMEARDRLTRIVDLLTVTIPLLLVGLPLFSTDLLRILAPAAYRPPPAVVAGLAVGIALWYLSLFLQKVLELQLRSHRLVLSLGIAAACNVALNLLLIPRFGMVGASIATACGYAAYAGLVVHASPAELRVWPPLRAVLDALIAALVFIAIERAGFHLWPTAGVVARLGLIAPLALLGYLAVVYYRGHLTPVLTMIRGTR
jgi:O-antigen/teichoic acid export membrane protein